ncbi:MAG TPA: site-2 protease family protein, partial [Aggregatilineaceae bacterium]|nr:site-2 protease family protein [Aggregatilineaceae bacterium]
GVVGAIAFIGSILWHEMAHALLALRYHIPVVQIVLYLFGGMAQIARDPERPGQEFWIAIAGPVSSVVLAVFFGFLAVLFNPATVVGAVCNWLFTVNLTLAIFNLVPGFPLDGGRVLRSALWTRGGSFRTATRQASRVGQGVAIGFALLGLALMFRAAAVFNGLWFMLIAAFLYDAATTSYRLSRGANLSMKSPVSKVMRYNVPLIEPTLPLALLAWKYMDHAPDQAYPVMDDGALIGMITQAEVEVIPRLEWGKVRVQDLMVPRDRLCIVESTDDLQTALQALETARMDHAPVYDHGHLVGMLNRRDIVYRT